MWPPLNPTSPEPPNTNVPLGVPVLRGPYVVDWTDLTSDGSTKLLWIPKIGDVLLRLFPDANVLTQWDTGKLYVGQNLAGVGPPSGSYVALANHGSIGNSSNGALDSVIDAADSDNSLGPLFLSNTSAYQFASADPVVIQIQYFGDSAPSQGHVRLYTLVASPRMP